MVSYIKRSIIEVYKSCQNYLYISSLPTYVTLQRYYLYFHNILTGTRFYNTSCFNNNSIIERFDAMLSFDSVKPVFSSGILTSFQFECINVSQYITLAVLLNATKIIDSTNAFNTLWKYKYLNQITQMRLADVRPIYTQKHNNIELGLL